MKSLRLTFSSLIAFVLLTSGWLFFIIGSLEVVARSPEIEQRLPSQGFGSSHRQFEIQLDRLARRYDKEGHIDCLFIGNSHTLRGIQPVYIERALTQQTGRPFVCQNVSLNGTSASLFAEMAIALAEEYRPQLVVVGISMVDFDTQRGGHGNKNIRLSPWFQYHYAHRITLDGLVIEYSYAYRYYLGWRRAFFFPERGMDRLGNPFENTLENGFLPSSETMDFGPLKKWLASLEDLPEEQAKNQLEQSPMGRIAQVALEPPEVAQFEELLVSDIPIVAVELPFSPYAYILSEQKHDEFLAMMSRLTDMHGDLFIPSYGIVSIPENGWLDLKHMNQFGAKVFSQWLAGQLVEKGLSAQLLEAHE